MDYGRRPAQFLDRLQHAAGEKDGPFVVVGEFRTFAVGQHGLAREIVVVVDEIDLHARRGDRGDLDDELVVVVVDDEVHARKTYYLVELVPAFVDTAVARHEGTDFVPTLLHRLRESAAKSGSLRLWKIGCNLLTDVQNLICHGSSI